VIGGSFAVESFSTLEAVLEAVFDFLRLSIGVDEAAGSTRWGEAATDPSIEMASDPGAGPASLLAAQAREARRAKESSTVIDEYLSNKV
jgi:hypothetical protein